MINSFVNYEGSSTIISVCIWLLSFPTVWFLLKENRTGRFQCLHSIGCVDLGGCRVFTTVGGFVLPLLFIHEYDLRLQTFLLCPFFSGLLLILWDPGFKE